MGLRRLLEGDGMQLVEIYRSSVSGTRATIMESSSFSRTLMSTCRCGRRSKSVQIAFLAMVMNATHQTDSFRRQHIGRNSFMSIVNDAGYS